MTCPLSPRDALDLAIARGLLDQTHRNQPGAIVDRLPSETREALRELTSEHTMNVREDWMKR